MFPLFIALCFLMLGAIMFDGYTTMIGMQHGMMEGNVIARWLFKKIGQQWTLWGFAVLSLFIAGAFTSVSFGVASTFAGVLAGLEAYTGIKNYLLLRKNKIGLK